MITYDECTGTGLLRRIAPSAQQAKEQFEKSKILLKEARKSIEIGSPNSAMIAGYAAVLDAARAVLFRDGWREKSHACVARYLESAYPKEMGDFIYLMDEYRDQRHKTMYAGSYYPTTEEAKRVVEFADKFLAKIGQMLKGEKPK